MGKRKHRDEEESHAETRPKKRRKKSHKNRRSSKKKVSKKHRSSGRRKTGSKKRRRADAGIGGRRGGIPVEGLAGAGTSGRYPGPAKTIEQLVTRTWRPDPNQNLNTADVIHFSMRVRKGQIIR